MTKLARPRSSTEKKSGAKNWLTVAGLASLAPIGIVNGFRASSEGSWMAFVTDVYIRVSQKIDWRYHWWRLPSLPAIAVLLAARIVYRRKNLVDTNALPATNPLAAPPLDQRYLTARSPDGTYNDLNNPTMGAAGT